MQKVEAGNKQDETRCSAVYMESTEMGGGEIEGQSEACVQG